MAEELAQVNGGVGRPTVRNEEINRKIEEAAAIGASIEEIAFYININRATLYRWMAEDEELKDRIEELQEKPIMRARQTIVKALDNPMEAKWYLEKKRKKEFGNTEEQNINILMPVLVKFLDKKDDEGNNNGNTKRIS